MQRLCPAPTSTTARTSRNAHLARCVLCTWSRSFSSSVAAPAAAAVEVHPGNTTTTTTAGTAGTAGITTENDITITDLPTRWPSLTPSSKTRVSEALLQVQKKDWKGLSFEEKRALYWIAFGPHGIRESYTPPGFKLKVFLGTVAATGIGALAFYLFDRQYIKPNQPATLSPEYMQKTNEWAKENRVNPIHGVSSGKNVRGFVQ